MCVCVWWGGSGAPRPPSRGPRAADPCSRERVSKPAASERGARREAPEACSAPPCPPSSAQSSALALKTFYWVNEAQGRAARRNAEAACGGRRKFRYVIIWVLPKGRQRRRRGGAQVEILPWIPNEPGPWNVRRARDWGRPDPTTMRFFALLLLSRLPAADTAAHATCPPGTFRSTLPGGDSVSSGVCLPCTPGHWCGGGVISPCTAGRWGLRLPELRGVPGRASSASGVHKVPPLA